MAVAAILLATGDVRIDGVRVALLPWADGMTLIEYQIEQLQDAGMDVIEVVLGPEAESLIPVVSRDNVEPIVHARWHDGDAASLRAGAAAVPRDTEKALIVRVEEPRPSSVHRALLDAHHAVKQITRPSFRGAPGTPIVAGYDVLGAIRNMTRADVGMDALMSKYEIVEVPLESDVVLLTIHTRDDYDRARAALGSAL